jgi:hypothetical protein
MSRVYKTARGKSLDMASLIARQEQTRAVSNINAINSRGDEIDSNGNIVKPNTQRVADSYASQVGTQGAVPLQERPENPNLSKSANPNAPLSPKQQRELDALEKESSVVEEVKQETPMLNKLVEESKPEAVTEPVAQATSQPDPVVQETIEPSESEIMQADLEPIIPPEEFVMKSADEAPDSFGAEGELHPEEAELADLEEDFDIEAIKKAALENIITETPKATSKKKGKK